MTQKQTNQDSNLQQLGEIPVKDPDAALRFCRTLAGMLAREGYGPPRAGIDPAPFDVPEGTNQIDPAKPEFSVVLPVFNEEENIPVLYTRLINALETAGLDFEIIFVDDGSHDSTPERLRELIAQDNRVTVVELARNFGHQVAITAGLDHARGKAAIVMDADLQDPPELLPKFIAKWREGYDVVYAIRTHRPEGRLKRSAYSLFYRLLRRIANIDMPLDSGDFCIMDRRVIDLLGRMPERNRFLRGIRSWVGLNQTGIAYERQSRNAGQTKYTYGRLLLLALDGLISFSYVPLRVIAILGCAVSSVSLVMATFYFVKRLTTGLGPPGFATLVVSLFFLSGVQLITLGVIGEYIGRIFDEVKRRPLYVLRSVKRGRP